MWPSDVLLQNHPPLLCTYRTSVHSVIWCTAVSIQVHVTLIVGPIMFSTVVYFSCEMYFVCSLVCTHFCNVESVTVLTESLKCQKVGSNGVNSCNPLVVIYTLRVSLWIFQFVSSYTDDEIGHNQIICLNMFFAKFIFPRVASRQKGGGNNWKLKLMNLRLMVQPRIWETCVGASVTLRRVTSLDLI
jgi:hypothetical protein